ncbi:MAG: hypothetical protein WCW33_02725 [Candidatus Babeliales bacterium]
MQYFPAFLSIIIVLCANLRAMDPEPQQPMDADARLSPSPFDIVADPLFDNDDKLFSADSAQPLQQSNQAYIFDAFPDMHVPLLKNQYFFCLVDDLPSKMLNRRLLAYDLWRVEKESQRHLKVRTIIACEIAEEKLYVEVACFDNNEQSIKKVSHQWATVVEKPFPPLATIIRYALEDDLIKTLQLFDSQIINCIRR